MMGTRTGLALAAIGAVLAFVGHGRLQLAGIALMLAATAGLWLRRRPGWTRRRAESIGGWLTAAEGEAAGARRVPLEDIMQAPPEGFQAGQQAAPHDH
jgi:hypothetical protein